MSNEFVKVTQGDARNQSVNVKGIKPINNVKIIRADEESLSSEADTVSSYSDSEPRQKKTKKVKHKQSAYGAKNMLKNTNIYITHNYFVILNL
jgi:hypothetical protein